MATKMKIVKRREAGSDQTCARTARKGGLRSCGRDAPSAARAGSTPATARSATTKAMAETQPETATRRALENGSRKCPASGAVTAKPAIIMTQTIVAAAPRRRSSTPVARSTRSEVLAAPAPIPTVRKDRTARARPPA